MKAAAGVASSVRPVASVPQVRLPAEEAAAASGAKVQPPGAAGAESAPSARQPGAAEVASDAEVAQPPEAAGVALDAVAEPQQAVAAEGLLDVEVQRPGVAERSRRLRCGSRRRRTLRRRLLLGARGALFPGLRHDERCGLRMRCGGRELRRRQGSRGEQQDAKVCHDVLGPRNRPDSNGTAFIGMSVGRLNG